MVGLAVDGQLAGDQAARDIHRRHEGSHPSQRKTLQREAYRLTRGRAAEREPALLEVDLGGAGRGQREHGLVARESEIKLVESGHAGRGGQIEPRRGLDCANRPPSRFQCFQAADVSRQTALQAGGSGHGIVGEPTRAVRVEFGQARPEEKRFQLGRARQKFPVSGIFLTARRQGAMHGQHILRRATNEGVNREIVVLARRGCAELRRDPQLLRAGKGPALRIHHGGQADAAEGILLRLEGAQGHVGAQRGDAGGRRGIFQGGGKCQNPLLPRRELAAGELEFRRDRCPAGRTGQQGPSLKDAVAQDQRERQFDLREQSRRNNGSAGGGGSSSLARQPGSIHHQAAAAQS